MSSLHSAALDYAGNGWPVFPLVPGGKKPLTPNGLKDGSTDKAVIDAWWTQWPTANIGIVTGAASGLVVVDVDKKSNGYESLVGIERTKGELATLTASTGGGGLHFYYAHPGTPTRNKAGLYQGIDVRADGGYVVAPPSMHESGTKYTWHEINEHVEPLPAFLLAQLQEPTRAPVTNSSAAGEVGEGGRNHYLASVAGALQRKGVSEAALSAALHAENEEKCSPPLPEYEVEAIVRSVGRYAPSAPVDMTGALDANASLVVRASDLSKSMLEHISDKAKVKGKPTGLEGLDKMLGGGKRTGEVTAWHAEAKTGKNTLWHLLQYYWLECGIPIAYASRELTPESEVLPNILSLKFLENAWLAEMDAARCQAYTGALGSWPLYFSKGYGYMPLEDIRRWIGELRSLGVEYFWFDHLHYMLEDPEDHKAASKLIKEIKTIAKQEDIHVDIIIQPNKLADGQRLSLNSMKGGAAMGQAIDNLIILERVKQEGVKNVSKLTLEVARSKLCKPGHIYLTFDPDTTMFTETDATTIDTRSEPAPERYPTIVKPWGNQYRIDG